MFNNSSSTVERIFEDLYKMLVNVSKNINAALYDAKSI